MAANGLGRHELYHIILVYTLAVAVQVIKCDVSEHSYAEKHDKVQVSSTEASVLGKIAINNVAMSDREMAQDAHGSIGQNQPIVTWKSIENRCKAFLDSFAESAAKFVMCTIQHARPLTFCVQCVAEYVVATTSYREIMKNAGKRCKDLILYSDRIMVVNQVYTSVTTVWSRSHCGNCFESTTDVNGTVEATLSKSTVHFQFLINQTMKCVQNYTQSQSVGLDGVEQYIDDNVTVSANVCTECKPLYAELNTFYASLDEEHKNNICMDLVDTMNYTRQMWSKGLHCTRKHEDVVPVILLSVLFSLMPIIFYIANKVHGAKSDKKLLKQKRMKNTAAGASTSLSAEIEG